MTSESNSLDVVVENPPRRLHTPVQVDAVTALGVHVFLLLIVPSNLTLAGLGAYGRPSLIWGLMLLLWWLVWQLRAAEPPVPWVRQPGRFFLLAFFVVALVSFAAALLRGQPIDQISPAISALVRIASWAGVFLVAMDGLTLSRQLVRLTRLLVLVGAALAMLGLAQFATGQTFLAWVSGVPGIQFNADDTVSARGTFSRGAGTAIHPLEFVTVLIGLLPMAIICGVTRGFLGKNSKAGVLWWLPAALIALSCVISVSRSAIIGLLVAGVVSLPAVPRRQRRAAVTIGVIGLGVVAVVVPGLFRTIFNLFVGASEDSSTQSRTDALARVPEFMSSSPLVGAGFGTFLPRYYIFDNQWVMLLVELGVLGTAAFGGLILATIWSALQARRGATSSQQAMLAQALVASLVALATSYSLFDALAFPMSAGLLYLVAGLSAALYRISMHAEQSHRPRLVADS